MCCLNKRLHVANNNGKVFEYKDDKLIENINLTGIKYLYNFANNTIVWRFNDKIE